MLQPNPQFIFGCGSFGRWLQLRVKPSRMGLVPLFKEKKRHQGTPSPLPAYKATVRRARSRSLPDTETARVLILDFPVFKIVK